ncbi:MAG: low molecular weight phosphotyrosine protein phosphatase [gamma proteobacterium symbiont of Taylorina sp.]|nr:low molecular weight phosphotyrosine protein phosphatase [gamma proteobacterium symbiont of Taylorina sp.]
MDGNNKIKVLFVCMGNICRSPTAHGVFEYLVNEENLSQQIEIDSAGTHAYHVGNPPDTRAQETAKNRGFDLSHLRARQVDANDFSYYDYILAMDNDNYELLVQACPVEYKSKIKLFLEFAENYPLSEVPDPYYGGHKGFENVFDMVEVASKGLLEEIKKNY